MRRIVPDTTAGRSPRDVYAGDLDDGYKTP
jgi:hypothetical protein